MMGETCTHSYIYILLFVSRSNKDQLFLESIAGIMEIVKEIALPHVLFRWLSKRV
jgi:hypothetical protein